MEHTGFPSDETLAAFIDGRLDPDTRRRVVEHMTTCEECYSVVLGGAEGPQVLAFPHPERHSNQRRLLFAVLAAAAAVIVAVTLLLGPRFSRPADREMRMLVDVAPPARTTVGRLAVFPYRPHPVLRGSSDAPKPDYRLLAAVAEIESLSTSHPTVANLHALGAAKLMVRDWEAAATALESAVRLETGQDETSSALRRSRDAELLTDLSVAYYAIARNTDKAARYNDAIEAAEGAWNLSHSPVVAWNRAVAVEALHITPRSLAAWQDYLAVAGSDPGVQEAQTRVRLLTAVTDSEQWDRDKPRLDQAIDRSDRALVAEIAGRFPRQTREYAENELVPSWAYAESAGDAAAANKALARARIAAAAVRDQPGGDSLVADAIAAIDRAPLAHRKNLAALHVQYAKARDLRARYQYDAAASQFLRVKGAFQAEGSPFALLASIYAAATQYDKNEYPAAIITLNAADAGLAHQADYIAATGLSRWIRGICSAATGDLPRALALYDEALASFRKRGELDNVLAMRGMQATLYDYIGDADTAWAMRFDALEMTGKAGVLSTRAPQVFYAAARSAMRDGRIATADILLERVLDLAKGPQWAPVRLETFAARSSLKALIGDETGARRAADAVWTSAGMIADAGARQDAMSNAEVMQALTRRASGIGRVNLLRGALTYLSTTQDHLRRADLLSQLAEANLLVRDRDGARRAMDDALREIELQQPAGAVEIENAFLERRQATYDVAAQIALTSGDVRGAFDIVDRSRFAAFFRSRNEAVGPPKTVCHPDERTAIVAFRSFPDGLVAWVLDHDDIRVSRMAVRSGELRALSSQLASAAQEPAHFDQISERLFTRAFGPIGSLPERVKTLVIIPDASMAGIPFDALRDPRAGRYLVEEYRVIVAPSLATHCACMARDESLARRADRSVLISGVFNPRGQQPLDRVEGEIDGVAAVYLNGVVLRDRDATRSRWLQAASQHSIVHFAGHGLFNSQHPDFSALFLASDGSGDGTLYARHIAATRFARTRVMLLNACGSGAGAMASGSAGVAYAFVAAGVPMVIGSNWAIDDGETTPLLIQVHRRMLRGCDAATALRLSKLEMLRHSPPAVWATFEAIGGAIERENA
jgi:CHAT domain-containing protein/tetratricopeptide (TPR) repeat protein